MGGDAYCPEPSASYQRHLEIKSCFQGRPPTPHFLSTFLKILLVKGGLIFPAKVTLRGVMTDRRENIVYRVIEKQSDFTTTIYQAKKLSMCVRYFDAVSRMNPTKTYVIESFFPALPGQLKFKGATKN